MLETHGDDHGFAPEEQTEILMMAARLQEEQRDRLSVDQLERLGQEAGIDPLFVRLAIERRSAVLATPTPKKMKGPATPKGYPVMMGSFIVLQTLAMVEFLSWGPRVLFPLPLILVAIWIIGMLLPEKPERRRKSLMFLVGSTMVLGLGITLLQKMTSGSVSAGWMPDLPFFLILEGLALWAGTRIESWLGTVRRLFDNDPTPNV